MTIDKDTKKILWLVVYVIWMVGDVEGFWDRSHALCLLLGVGGTCCLAFAELDEVKQASQWSAGAIVVGIALYWYFYENSPPPITPPTVVIIPPPAPPVSTAPPRTFEGGPGIPFEDTEVRGVLKPANAPTPSNGCDRIPLDPDALKILIGDNAVTHTGFGKFTAVRIKACDAIVMERRPDGVFVDASLFDTQGQAVVTIKDNRISALNGENYVARQASDESTIRVRNRAGTELFNVAFLNSTTIQVRGFFGCQGGQIIHVTDNGPIPGTIIRGMCSVNSRTAIQIGPDPKPRP